VALPRRSRQRRRRASRTARARPAAVAKSRCSSTTGSPPSEAGDFCSRAREPSTDGHIRRARPVRHGRGPGPDISSDITLFKSVGLAIEDVAAAQHIYSKARGSGFGKFVEFGGGRHDAD
jgi:ornithine cyclodeaminase/alanine dehydrogenase-like protein (mu-crystallin family)